MAVDPTTVERIRSIFLHRGPQITPTEAARLLDLSDRTMKEMIEQGEIESVGTCNGPMIAIHELAEQALQLWSMSTIEEALGKDASLVLPAGVRTRTFAVRLPRYVIAAVEHVAQQNDETAEMLLTRELRGWVFEHKECLVESVPGFAEAVGWPGGDDSAPVC